VVADEVRRLAERSRTSTREITSFVEVVQRDAKQAVHLAGHVLGQISQSSSKTQGLASEMSLATQEQTTGAGQILQTSSSMQKMTREVADAAKAHARWAQDIMKAVEAVKAMSREVANSSGEQKKGGRMVVTAVEQIAQIAAQNVQATQELSRATLDLAQQAERLQRMAEAFRL